MNLWKETIKTLEEEGYTWDDVESVFGEDFQITKENFHEVAYRTVYANPPCMYQMVAIDLQILLKDGSWMERTASCHSNICIERWDMHKTPTPPAEIREVKHLMTQDIGWDSLKECNEDNEEENNDD